MTDSSALNWTLGLVAMLGVALGTRGLVNYVEWRQRRAALRRRLARLKTLRGEAMK